MDITWLLTQSRDISASNQLKNLFRWNIISFHNSMQEITKHTVTLYCYRATLLPTFIFRWLKFQQMSQILGCLTIWMYTWHVYHTSHVMSNALYTNACRPCCSHLAVLFVLLKASLYLVIKSSVSDNEQKFTMVHEITNFYYKQ